MPVSRWVYSRSGGSPVASCCQPASGAGAEGAAVRDGRLGDLDLQRGRVLDVTAVDAVRVDVREMRPVQRIVMQQQVVDGHLERAAQYRPAGLPQRGQVGRLGPAAQRRIAGPDPDERRPLPDWVAAHLSAVGHVPLGRHADAPAVRREREAVVAAHDLVPVERAHRQRRGAVRAAVVEHRQLAVVLPEEEQPTPKRLPGEQRPAHLVTRRDHIPAVERVIAGSGRIGRVVPAVSHGSLPSSSAFTGRAPADQISTARRTPSCTRWLRARPR